MWFHVVFGQLQIWTLLVEMALHRSQYPYQYLSPVAITDVVAAVVVILVLVVVMVVGPYLPRSRPVPFNLGTSFSIVVSASCLSTGRPTSTLTQFSPLNSTLINNLIRDTQHVWTLHLQYQNPS